MISKECMHYLRSSASAANIMMGKMQIGINLWAHSISRIFFSKLTKKAKEPQFKAIRLSPTTSLQKGALALVAAVQIVSVKAPTTDLCSTSKTKNMIMMRSTTSSSKCETRVWSSSSMIIPCFARNILGAETNQILKPNCSKKEIEQKMQQTFRIWE